MIKKMFKQMKKRPQDPKIYRMADFEKIGGLSQPQRVSISCSFADDESTWMRQRGNRRSPSPDSVRQGSADFGW